MLCVATARCSRSATRAEIACPLLALRCAAIRCTRRDGRHTPDHHTHDYAAHPPPVAAGPCAQVCILVGQKPTWPLSQHILTRRRFVDGLLRLNPEDVKPNRRVIAKRLLSSQGLAEKAAAAAAAAASPPVALAFWLCVLLGEPPGHALSRAAAAQQRASSSGSGGPGDRSGGTSPREREREAHALPLLGGGHRHGQSSPTRGAAGGSFEQERLRASRGGDVARGAGATRRRSVTGGMWSEQESGGAATRMPAVGSTAGGSFGGDGGGLRGDAAARRRRRDRRSAHHRGGSSDGGEDAAPTASGSPSGRRGRRRSRVTFDLPGQWTEEFDQYLEDPVPRRPGGGAGGREPASPFTLGGVIGSKRREAERRRELGGAGGQPDTAGPLQADAILLRVSTAALAQARFALSSVSARKLAELTKLQRASEAEVAVNAALCLIFRQRPSRDALVRVTAGGVLARMQRLSPHDVPPRMLQITNLLSRRHRFPEVASRNVNQTVRVVAQWLAAMTGSHAGLDKPAGHLPNLIQNASTSSASLNGSAGRLVPLPTGSLAHSPVKGTGSGASVALRPRHTPLRSDESMRRIQDFCGLDEAAVVR